MGGRLEICIDSYESASNAVKGGEHYNTVKLLSTW
ncbi:unnamed protein product [Nippostrongylus brasiliensis]|uniref:Transposase n=1 Tax=Nippostrongylus brasiliensis TaxID=27835 RepID=A0A0N4YBI6_NIPBR|nr:unnamed protein product [Nippostrongylus brasiliensis]